MSAGFASLKLAKWKQFASIDLEFHPQLTVLTGANGSGKTTIMNLLARHFGWDFHELATATDEANAWLFSIADIRDVRSFVSKLKESSDEVSKYLFERFSTDVPGLLSTPEPSIQPIVEELNLIVQSTPESLYRALETGGVNPIASLLSDEEAYLLKNNPTGLHLLRLNRKILERAYPVEIAKNQETPTRRFKYFLNWYGLGLDTADDNFIRVGELRYMSGKMAQITIPKEGSPVYDLTIRQRESVSGLSIPSHRPVYSYAAVNNVSTQKRSRTQAFDLSSESQRTRYFGSGGNPVNFHLKETLLSWAIFGGGNSFIQPDSEQAGYFTGFESVLKKVLPEHIRFESITIRGQADVVLKTKSGDFVLDACSGGLSAIIDLAWHIYLKIAEEKVSITVLIDEVENHLHADMQRRLLPSFIKAFPNVQFIVSTHSPLIVGSLKDSSVYALRYNSENKVFSTKLDLATKAKAANDVLREVLGVPFTMPIWVEEQLKEIVSRYGRREFTEEVARELKTELIQAGLEQFVPETLVQADTRRP